MFPAGWFCIIESLLESGHGGDFIFMGSPPDSGNCRLTILQFFPAGRPLNQYPDNRRFFACVAAYRLYSLEWSNMIEHLKHTDFVPHLKSKFRAALANGKVLELELVEVQEGIKSPMQEAFALVFRAPQAA